MRTSSLPHIHQYHSVLKTVFAAIIVLSLAGGSLGEVRNGLMQDEILKFEKDFAQAVIKNDADAVGEFLSDDWIIIDPDGGVIDKVRFLAVIKSGALTHETMDSDDVRVRVYGDTATATALTRTKGKFMGQDFTTQERATDILVMKNGRWQVVFSQLTKFNKN